MKNYLGIDIGGTSVKMGIVNEEGVVLLQHEASVSFDNYQTPIIETVVKAAHHFNDSHHFLIEGIAISAAGQIDTKLGKVIGTCGNLPNYIGSEFKSRFEKEFNLKVTVVNDANCMILGEKWIDDIAIGLVSLIHIFNPSCILIGGGVSSQEEFLINPLREKVFSLVMPRFKDNLVLMQAKLKNTAGIIGAVYYYIYNN